MWGDGYYDDAGNDDLTELEQLEQWVDDNPPDLQYVLIEYLAHQDQEMRITAALHLAELYQDVAALPVLMEAVDSGSRPLQRQAESAVWIIGDESTAELIRALHFETGAVRDAITRTLAWVGWAPEDTDTEIAFRIAARDWAGIVALGDRAVPALVSALSDPDGTVRRGAIWVLGLIGDPRAVPFVAECLSDTSGDLFGAGGRICDIAAESLVRIGTDEAQQVLAGGRSGRPRRDAPRRGRWFRPGQRKGRRGRPGSPGPGGSPSSRPAAGPVRSGGGSGRSPSRDTCGFGIAVLLSGLPPRRCRRAPAAVRPRPARPGWGADPRSR